MDAPWDDGQARAEMPGLMAHDARDESFSDIDLHFADLMEKMASRLSPGIREAAALVSRFTRQGHTCIDLAPYAGRALDGGAGLPGLSAWRSALLASGVVGGPGEYRPMVLDATSRLYLWRYWSYQQALAEALLAMAHREVPVDAGAVGPGIAALFPAGVPGAGIDWQKAAVLVALKSGLGIVTGGPGTGKTTVVTKILALLAHAEKGLKVALAAPTGKAAQRMEEAVAGTRAELSVHGGGQTLPELRANTIHRLLGMVPGRARARFSRSNPLPYDVVVVDEASMIPLSLMTRLVLALKPSARLILVGDRNQLASVEPGHVMGDICATPSGPCYSPRTCGIVRGIAGYELPEGSPTGVEDCLVELRTAYRFGPDSGIRALGEAVKAGDADSCRRLLGGGGMDDVAFHDLGRIEPFPRAAAPALLEGYAPYLGDGLSEDERFRLFGSFRVLCALREGPYGVEAINRLIERILAGRGLIRLSGAHYHGRPVLVTANDYTLGLFNGDVGMVLRDGDGELRCFFQGPGASLRRISVARLPEHETAYAMTVHKSQGSEFTKIMLVLPPKDSPVLSRELVYTGITRAREGLGLWTTPEVFSTAVERRTQRTSGLGDLLAGKLV